MYDYFEILKDTLMLHELPAWRKSKKRKPLASSKYYFFDIGVVSALQEREFRPRTPEFGEAFETYILHDLICYRDYIGGDSLSYWQSTSGFEVDFFVKYQDGNKQAIQVAADVSDPITRDRECRALIESQSIMPDADLLLINLSEEATIAKNGVSIELVPAWKWLLHNI